MVFLCARQIKGPARARKRAQCWLTAPKNTGKPVRGYDYCLASELAHRRPVCTASSANAGLFAVNARKTNGAARKHLRPDDNTPHWPRYCDSGGDTSERNVETVATELRAGPAYLFSSQRTTPNPAENTRPIRSASSRNFRFFLVTFGSGSSGLGLAGIMTGSSAVDSWPDSFRQGFCFE